MQLRVGTIITSTDELKGTIFENASVIITEYNHDGAVGFIFNKPFSRRLNDLQEFKNISFPLYEGGPVDQEHLYFVHCRPDLVEDGQRLDNRLYFGGNFRQVIGGITQDTLSPADVKIFVGYCGWNAGELEAEIQEGSWALTTTTSVL